MTDGEITSQQHALLRALLNDSTDEKIAAELHVARRTMQRWLKELMEKAGVPNRFALGAHAARNGWLDQRDDWAGRYGGPRRPINEYRQAMSRASWDFGEGRCQAQFGASIDFQQPAFQHRLEHLGEEPIRSAQPRPTGAHLRYQPIE